MINMHLVREGKRDSAGSVKKSAIRLNYYIKKKTCVIYNRHFYYFIMIISA